MKLVGVDIFSGAGGMSVGAEWSDIQTKFAIDSDANASETYKQNHPNADVFCEDVRGFDFSVHKPRERSVLFGGPPCQGFSTSNQRTRSAQNEANWLFTQFLRAVSEFQPAWVVFENVKGITETENAGFLMRVIKGLERLGYQTKHTVLNARDFGVPQSRSRLFIVGSREIEHFEFPKPTLAKVRTVQDAISDLPVLANGSTEDQLPYQTDAQSDFAQLMRGDLQIATNNSVTRNSPNIVQRYRHIPQGGNWSDIPARLMQNYKDVSRCHTGIYRRLKWDEPAITIGNYRKNMLVHPGQDRGLSVREAARLQSFPDSFRFYGSIGFQQQQVGNAVPPLLAHAIFEQVSLADNQLQAADIAAE